MKQLRPRLSSILFGLLKLLSWLADEIFLVLLNMKNLQVKIEAKIIKAFKVKIA